MRKAGLEVGKRNKKSWKDNFYWINNVQVCKVLTLILVIKEKKNFIIVTLNSDSCLYFCGNSKICFSPHIETTEFIIYSYSNLFLFDFILQLSRWKKDICWKMSNIIKILRQYFTVQASLRTNYLLCKVCKNMCQGLSKLLLVGVCTFILHFNL